jgi:peroxiredoxin
MTDPLPVGSKAPGFKAEASDGRTYTLAEVLKTKHVALVFYPGNNTPG